MHNYLIKPTRHERGKWVAAKSSLSRKDIRTILLNSEIFVSDLDKSIAKAPTEKVILKNLFYNPRTLLWAAVSILRIVKSRGKKKPFDVWREYFPRFGDRIEKDIERIVINLEKENKTLLYPGIRGFFDYLYENCPEQKRILVTRTDKRVGWIYQGILGFNQAHYNKFEKYEVIDELISKYSPRTITIAGDSDEDKKMVERARGHNIECLGIKVVRSPKKIDEDFDINIGRNWKGLQEIINGY